MLLTPAPPLAYLAVFKSDTSVQFVPFQDSVIATAGSAPQSNADVETPDPVSISLPVFKSLTSVQLLPSHNSVFVRLVTPPDTNAAVLSAAAPAE